MPPWPSKGYPSSCWPLLKLIKISASLLLTFLNVKGVTFDHMSNAFRMVVSIWVLLTACVASFKILYVSACETNCIVINWISTHAQPNVCSPKPVVFPLILLVKTFYKPVLKWLKQGQIEDYIQRLPQNSIHAVYAVKIFLATIFYQHVLLLYQIMQWPPSSMTDCQQHRAVASMQVRPDVYELSPSRIAADLDNFRVSLFQSS